MYYHVIGFNPWKPYSIVLNSVEYCREVKRMPQPGNLQPMRRLGQDILADLYKIRPRDVITFVEVKDLPLRHLFDRVLDAVHYAKSCQRVGRCMRLAILLRGHWVGGIVLGSTFPNVDARDEFLGLKKYIRGYGARGLTSPWSAANRPYWRTLQTIVNHARTFVFPEFQGRGIGIEAHRSLLSSGIRVWEKKYGHKVYALDTLCDHTESALFVKNGWVHVGETRGYTADYQKAFSAKKKPLPRINNAALCPGRTKWQVWVRVVRPSLQPA